MSTGSEGQYSPKLVTLTIGTPTNSLLGDITIPGLPQGLSFPAVATGYAPDSFITVTATTDSVTMVAGAEGNVQHVHNHDASGTIAVSVQQNTNMCRLLGILFNAQKLIGDGQIPAFNFPVTVRDNNTLPPTVHQGFNCLIMRNPDTTYGASISSLTWTFSAAKIISNRSSNVF